MSTEQTSLPPAPVDERQQMLLSARAHTIGHCESRLLDFQAWGNAFWAWLGCNLVGLIFVGIYFFKQPFLAYAIALFANVASFPIALACARGAYSSTLRRYKDDREAAGLAEIN